MKLPVNQRPESWSDSLLSFTTKGPAKLQSSSSTQRPLAVLRAQDEANGLRSLSVGDEVAGIVPPDSRMGGCATYTIQRLHNLVRKPALVLHEDAAAALGPDSLHITLFFTAEHTVRRYHLDPQWAIPQCIYCCAARCPVRMQGVHLGAHSISAFIPRGACKPSLSATKYKLIDGKHAKGFVEPHN